MFKRKEKEKHIDVDCVKEDKKEIVKNKLVLKARQTFKRESHYVFTEVIME